MHCAQEPVACVLVCCPDSPADLMSARVDVTASVNRAMKSDYFRHQARRCLQWAQDCYDLTAAERLRLLAEEFAREASRLELEARLNNVDRREGGPARNSPDAGTPKPQSGAA